jgi:hypothetical protein
MSRRGRRGQSVTESLLLTSVLVVAVIAAGWVLAGVKGGGGIVGGLSSMADGAKEAYVDPSRSP